MVSRQSRLRLGNVNLAGGDISFSRSSRRTTGPAAAIAIQLPGSCHLGAALMRFAMCNEFCSGWSVAETCELAAQAGFAGVEFAPFTLGPTVFDISSDQRRQVRQTVADHGLSVVGLHWLLAKTTGLHIHHGDPATRRRTADYYRELIRCCAEMGGDRMIHGSPAQRNLAEGQSLDEASKRTADFFAAAAPFAAEHGVSLCIEPLGPADTNFIQSKDQALKLIRQVNHPAVTLILDCKAMACDASGKPITQIIREARGQILHVHANDDNQSYPGSGTLDFDAIMKTLVDIGYDNWVSIEVFDFTPPPQQIAHEGLTHLKQALAQTRC
jgi:sugar phosphate isomerase/epimerase